MTDPTPPLAGRTVVVTRATTQASTLVDALTAHGARIVAVPVIAIADASDGGTALHGALDDLSSYDWLVVTSANGADRVADRLDPSRLETVATRVAAIGPGTVDALARHGIAVDLVPERFVAEGLLAAFPPVPPGGGRVLLAQAAAARPVLREGLVAAGWTVDAVEAYRTVHPVLDPDLVARAARADAITFTSASTVRGYVAAAGPDAVPQVVASIGPITSAAARELGIRVAVEAEEHTIDGLAAALVQHIRSLRSGG
ncbi:uroporphyrinogen-III synthase [Actinomarinicola tropica]|uniref:uroporphyrinogen-III synthase n=1 Tax=Actinomarinicola tropica TaxID=2789776 RepID=UPI00189C2B4C|nr:uroporphyrinogen-III synthase [Actinomarinicola tropica]